MELGGKVRESREIIRYVLLTLPECYEIVTGEPSKKTSSNIHKHTESRILFFLVCVKKICNKKSHSIKKKKRDFHVGRGNSTNSTLPMQVALGLIPHQGTRSHMPKKDPT